jgi:pimeloyl-ACP methyl ester carboxylesterase
MERTTGPRGTTVSYDRYGSGPPLVLVHGSFSDHLTNWQEVKPLLRDRFTVYAVARRGRGETTPTRDHSVDDEAADVVAVLKAVEQPAFLLGHSYGAVCALGAAAQYPNGVRKLVLYEHPGPTVITLPILTALERLAERRDWDALVETFMRDALQVPPAEIRAIKTTPFWQLWTADAEASLNDLRALSRHRFDAARYRSLTRPVQLLIGTQSPRALYFTDALAARLPDARVAELEGQAHEGMTTAPEQFVEAISRFLLQ